MTDYDKLRELAQNATPGPWKLAGGNEWLSPLGIDVGSEDECSHPTLRHRDAEFIAEANPAAVLNLLEDLRITRQERDAEKHKSLTHRKEIARLVVERDDLRKGQGTYHQETK